MTDPNEAPAADFHTAVERPEPWQRVIKVEVARAHYDGEYGRLLQSARKRAERPGFRRGHVPVALLEKELGAQLRAQALEQMIPQAYRAALEEHAFFPVNDPRVDKVSLDEGQPLRFEITVEVRPEITITGWEGLPLERREPRVKDGDVDAVVARLREGRALRERVDRGARAGDLLALDITPLGDDGQPDHARRIKGYEFELGEAGNIADFEEALAGTMAGDVREVVVAYPADHFNEQLRGQTVRYLCEILQVLEKSLPAVDDAFAAAIKPGETLLSLRGAIRGDLLKQDAETSRRELEEQLLDRLLEKNAIPVPPSLVAQYLETGLRELHERNERAGRANAPEEDERYRELTRPLAERVVRSIFLLEAVRRQAGIAVTDADVDARIEEIAREHGFDPDKYRQYAAEGPERERIARALEERRTFDFLLGHAVMTTVAEAAARE
mgnify:CR=1 FL=1